MTERDELHNFTGAYALGALDPHETASFEAYLTESEEARTEVAELTDTAVLLGMATRPITPPPALKARIMAELLTTPQLASEITDAQASELASVTPIGASNTTRATDSIPSADETRRIRRLANGSSKAQARWFARPAGILVAAAAAVGLFFAGAALGPAGQPQPQDLQAASFTELYSAPDLARQESSVVGGGKATLLWSDELQRAAVVVNDLPALAADKTYELWYIKGNVASPAGTFDVADSGATLRVLDGTLADDASIGLTIEPAGGSDSPTTDPIVVIQSA